MHRLTVRVHTGAGGDGPHRRAGAPDPAAHVDQPLPAPHLGRIEQAQSRLASTGSAEHADVITRLIEGLHGWLSATPIPAVEAAAATLALTLPTRSLDRMPAEDMGMYLRVPRSVLNDWSSGCPIRPGTAAAAKEIHGDRDICAHPSAALASRAGTTMVPALRRPGVHPVPRPQGDRTERRQPHGQGRAARERVVALEAENHRDCRRAGARDAQV